MRRSKRIAAQKRSREEEEQPLDLSKTGEKAADKKKRSNEETNDSSDDTNHCPICLETVRDSIVKSLPCAHVFHETCINQWLNISKMCPICRCPTTFETNDLPQVGADWPRETFEGESNGSSGSEFGGWNSSFELIDASGDPDLEEADNELVSEESLDDSETEESSEESQSEESRAESEFGEFRNEFESEDSHERSESEESPNEFETDGSSDMECFLM